MEDGERREEGEDKEFLEIIEKAQKEKKVKVKEIIIDREIMKKLLLLFFEASNRNEEDFLLLVGKIDSYSIRIDKIFEIPLLANTSIMVKPDGYYLLKCMEESVKEGRNCFIMAHRHPIGNQLSSIDRETLYNFGKLYDGFYIGVGCCDIEFSIYMIEDREVYRPILKLFSEEVECKVSLTNLEGKKIIFRKAVMEKICLAYKNLKAFMRKICGGGGCN